MKIGAVKLLRVCVLLGWENLRSVREQWKENHGLWYHLYMVFEELYSQEAVEFVYGDQMQCGIQHRREILLGEVDPFCLCEGKYGAGDNMVTNIDTLGYEETGDRNSAIRLWPDYWADALIEENQDSLSA